MAKLNITQSARAAGIARTTLYNHIKEGKISCEMNTQGQKVIDTAELIRVYGELKNYETSTDHSEGRSIEQTGTPGTSQIIQTFRERISDLEKQVEELRKDKEDSRSDIEASKKREEELLEIVKQQQILLLPDKSTEKVGFFSRLFGRK